MALISLLPFEKQDELHLYHTLLNSDIQNALYADQVVRSLPQFKKWLYRCMESYWHDFYLVKSNDDKPLGFVYSYEMNKVCGHCKLCVCITDAAIGSGCGALAGISFADRLFQFYPLRKLYSEIYSFNRQSLGLAMDMGLVEEGRLQDICWTPDGFADQYIFSITREKFYTEFSHLIQ